MLVSMVRYVCSTRCNMKFQTRFPLSLSHTLFHRYFLLLSWIFIYAFCGMKEKPLE